MLTDHDTRTAVFALSAKGHGPRPIARTLKISRSTVKLILRSGTAEVPPIERPEIAGAHIDVIKGLAAICCGNLVRVHEELQKKGVAISYSALTSFCRRRGIGHEPKKPIGELDFDPGEEMQHDTSPHTVHMSDRARSLVCASLVLCFSRRLFAQCYPRWNRFTAKVFLTDALRAMGGASRQCMLDNSSVIVVRGTGKNAVMAPEMVAFGERFGFHFAAHELGHADRSAYVERSFSYIEGNFYPGRTFADLDDLNAQLRDWCSQVDQRTIRAISARPIDLFVSEAPRLVPLPIHIPEPYRMHRRTVDAAAYVQLHRNNYSTPAALIDRELSVHESKDRVRLYDGHRFVCEHRRLEDSKEGRSTLEEHRRERQRLRERKPEPVVPPKEAAMRAASPVVEEMVKTLRKELGGRAKRPLDRLYRMWLDYPREPLDRALRKALDHGLHDLERIERLVLSYVSGDFFRLPDPDTDPDTDEDLMDDPEDLT